MSIQIEGDSLFQITADGGDPVLRMYFETRSVHSARDERFAFYQFQEDADDLKAVEDAMTRALAGTKGRVRKIGRSALSPEFFGGDNARAEDLLPAKDVTASLSFIKTTALDATIVQLSAEVGEKKPRIFKVQFQGKAPAELMKQTFQGKAKRITTDLGKMGDIQSDLQKIRIVK